jgi:hypothetical protein
MNQLKVHTNTDMDRNIEEDWHAEEYGLDQWIDYVKSLPHVIDVEYVEGIWSAGGDQSYTIITFESEAHRNWFVLRYS